RTNVGHRLTSVSVLRTDASGRAELIAIDGDRRLTLGGWDFKIIVGRVLGWNVLKSSRFEITRSGANFIFRGSGFGHGLGLCQEGAHVMAARGASYQKILEKYFPGTVVKRVTGESKADVLPGGYGYAGRSSSLKLLSISSENFRLAYPADVDRRTVDQIMNTLESTRNDYLRRASSSTPNIPRLEIRLNESTGDFTARTGQPWWA